MRCFRALGLDDDHIAPEVAVGRGCGRREGVDDGSEARGAMASPSSATERMNGSNFGGSSSIGKNPSSMPRDSSRGTAEAIPLAFEGRPDTLTLALRACGFVANDSRATGRMSREKTFKCPVGGFVLLMFDGPKPMCLPL